MIARDRPLAARQGMKGRQMRWVICALLMLGLAPRAFAQDFDILRGSESVGPAAFTNWSGFYLGAQVGYGAANGDFSGATAPIISYVLRETQLESEFSPSSWPVLGTASGNSTLYGGFVGYNAQWQNLILGIEGNYNQSKFSLVAPVTPIGRILPVDANGNAWTVVFTGSGSATDIEYGELRGRAGVILGNFLPYGFIGFALGHADISVNATGYAEANAPASASCSAFNTPPCYYVPFDKTNQYATLLYGGTVGTGLDWALTQHIFVRGEFEYVQFAPVHDIVLSALSGRVGVGLKF